jgi:O-antigen ligase
VALLAGVCAIYVIEPRVFEYLLLARIFDDADASPLGTFVDRFAQWHALLDYFASNPGAALYGLGTSGYGMMFFNSNEAGTHNLFLDLWAESGIIAPLLFIACLAVTLLGIVTANRTPRERGLLAAGLVMLVLLMTREHSVSYLYVTSMGGLCFAVILYLAVRATPEERA